MNRLQALLEAEMAADDTRAVGAIPGVLRPPGAVAAAHARWEQAHAALRTGAEHARARGQVVTPMPETPVPPDPRFPVWVPHPHPLDLLACWLVPALGDPHWSEPPCDRTEPEASL